MHYYILVLLTNSNNNDNYKEIRKMRGRELKARGRVNKRSIKVEGKEKELLKHATLQLTLTVI